MGAPSTLLAFCATYMDNRAPSQYEDGLSRHGDFHYKGKTVVRLSYLYNGISYTGETASLYWDSPQEAWIANLHDSITSLNSPINHSLPSHDMSP